MQLIEVHDAVFNRLNKFIDIPIYDYVPSDERAPFLVLRDTEFSFPDSLMTKTDDGYEVTQNILVVTEAMEKHEAVKIIKQIRKSLKEPFEIEGSSLMRQKMSGGKVEEIEDGLFIGNTGIELWLEDEEEEFDE